MRKLIAAINLTIDGFCDHTGMTPDEEIHDHYTALLKNADTILYGRKTYQLMQYWQSLLKNPSGEKSMDDFARAIDKIAKIVFSHTLRNEGQEALNWQSAKLAEHDPERTARELKRMPGGDILAGSRSLIVQLMNLNLIDEFQLCVHPVVAGRGLPLFDKLNKRTLLKLIKTKTFGNGAVLHYYSPEFQQ